VFGLHQREGDSPPRLCGLPRTTIAGVRYPVATTRLSRLLGLALLGRGRAGPGLVIPRCRSVHTFGMRFALDVFFLDVEGRFISRRPAVPPNRIVSDPRASAVLEVPSQCALR
jgi:uncharacterized membrane protein (UPF0127 family)